MARRRKKVVNQTNVKEPEALKSVEHLGNTSITHNEREDDHEHAHSLDWQEIARVLFVAFVAVAIWFVGRSTNPYIIAIGVICTVVGGFPISHEAYENITQRRMMMELSMAIAIIAALAIREIFTARVITLFVLVAEILEGLTVGRGRKAIQHLVDLLPSVATVRRNGSWTEVGIEDVSTMTKCSFGLGDVSQWMGKLSEDIPSSTRHRSPGSLCQLRNTPVRLSMLVRSTNPARSRFGLSTWAVTQPLERLLRQWKQQRNRVRRFKE
jgi:hypothetical protein